VVAADNATLMLRSVDAIEGGLFLAGNVHADLASIAIRDVAAFENASIEFNGGSANNVLVQDGTVNLFDVAVRDRASVGGVGHLGVGAGTRIGGDLANFGNERGRLVISGGSVAGNLQGTGTSITEMRGGAVAGFALFTEGATFLYSGGTIGNFGVPFARTSARLLDDAGSDDGDAFLRLAAAATGEDEDEDGFSPLAGFTLLGDAQMKLFGTGLGATLVDAAFVHDGLEFSAWDLRGRLLDGTPLDMRIYTANGGAARFDLVQAGVPAPDIVTMLGAGLFACLALRRRWHALDSMRS
jgi:hypothetical protein